MPENTGQVILAQHLVVGSRSPLKAVLFRCYFLSPLTFKPSRCIKASFYIPENRLIFPTTKGFRMKISMKLFYQYITIFLNFSPTSNHLHPLQVENCDSNSLLVVVEDDNGKLRPERVNEGLSIKQFIFFFMLMSCNIIHCNNNKMNKFVLCAITI